MSDRLTFPSSTQLPESWTLPQFGEQLSIPRLVWGLLNGAVLVQVVNPPTKETDTSWAFPTNGSGNIKKYRSSCTDTENPNHIDQH
ncbi:hypothetical protein ANO11243_067350 [Dothideomycetidae sp. 11243]|nr:hypothetical protein ANO11243_067350 [fungal sp. No.11243]